MADERLHYVDWLRVLAVLLLFPFHCGRVFNAGELFYAKSPIESVSLSYLIGFIDSWHMPLLFMLAGMATCFALRRRTLRQYVGERSLRLLVPLLFGAFVLIPPQTWMGSRTNAGSALSLVDYYTSGAFLDAANLLGRGDYYGGFSPGHLWFIMFLWIISMLMLPLVAFGRTNRGNGVWSRAARALGKPAWWPAAAFLILVGEGFPELGGKSIFVYTAFFALGYVVAHDTAFQDAAVRWRTPTLIAGLAIAVLGVTLWSIEATLPDPSWPRTLWTYAQNLGAWLTLVGMVGFGRARLDRPSRFLSYLAEASYPVYILHQTVIVLIGFYLVRILPWPYLGWPTLMALSVVATFALYEVVRRVGVLRFLFGMRPARR